MEGDHFFSDTIMSYIITFVVIKVLYDVFQFFPEDLNLKEKLKQKKLNFGGPARIRTTTK